MLVRAAVAVFSVIQTLLGLRLVVPLVDVPAALAAWVPTLYAVTDLLIAPFRSFAGPRATGPGFGQFEAAVIVALIAWSIVELLTVAILRIFTRPGDA